MSVPFLDLSRSSAELAPQLEAAALRVVRSGWYVLGPEVERFEQSFAEFVGAPHCIGVGNGLDAIRLALVALGVGAGDEVIVPANTYVATWIAVSQVGATPVGVEPNRETCNVDVAAIEAAVTPRTAAVIPVHLYGQPAEMSRVREVAARHGLAVVEDAAQAHGARWQGERVGSRGTACWSFYPSKNLGALGDAGAVTTHDAALAERLRMLRNYGSRRKYDSELPGLNSRLDELQAALLDAKLPVLDEWNARRAAVATAYCDGLAAVDSIRRPVVAAGAEPVWHLFVVRTTERARLRAHLDGRGIGTLVHYPIPPYRQGAYRHGGYSGGPWPISDALHDEVVSLPMGPQLAAEELREVVDALRSFVAVEPAR